MSDEKHPLLNNSSWLFDQYRLRMEVCFKSTDLEGGDLREHHIQKEDTCRETLVNNIRGVLGGLFVKKIPKEGRPYWDVELNKVREVDLADHDFKERFFGGHTSRMGIKCTELIGKAYVEEKVFLKVADTIVGNICVLLNPGRAPGDWWRTTPEECRSGDNNMIKWNGADNFFLYHPVMLTLVLGLYRQASHLWRAGVAEQILEDLPYERTEEAMTTADWRLARDNVRGLRRWIEVPVAKGGKQENYAFPEGLWLRFMRLQQAMRKHSAEEVFEGPFEKGWNLTKKTYDWTGSYEFWGLKSGDGTTGHYDRLLNLGRPAKKGNDDGKSAKEGARK